MSAKATKKRQTKTSVLYNVEASKAKIASPSQKRTASQMKKETVSKPDNIEQSSTSKKRLKKSTSMTENEELVIIKGPYDDLASTIMDAGWRKLLQPILESNEFRKILNFLNEENSAGKEIFPPKDLIFNSLNLTPLDKVKVVIIGQDPYPDGSAHGLAFSIPPEQEKLPSSLRTLYKELTEDPEIDFVTPKHGHLTEWAERGVLMLNAVLTVEAHKANSHSRCGWAKFTDCLLQRLTEHHNDLVFILWGNYAQKKKKQCNGNHIFLEGVHPSGLTCGKFYGCRHFSATNNALKKLNKGQIDWKIT